MMRIFILRKIIAPTGFLLALGAAAALSAGAARAQMTVEITGVGSQQFPIAVANFQVEGSIPQDISGIIRADLARSGVFRIVDAGGDPVSEAERVRASMRTSMVSAFRSVLAVRSPCT